MILVARAFAEGHTTFKNHNEKQNMLIQKLCKTMKESYTNKNEKLRLAL